MSAKIDRRTIRHSVETWLEMTYDFIFQEAQRERLVLVDSGIVLMEPGLKLPTWAASCRIGLRHRFDFKASGEEFITLSPELVDPSHQYIITTCVYSPGEEPGDGYWDRDHQSHADQTGRRIALGGPSGSRRVSPDEGVLLVREFKEHQRVLQVLPPLPQVPAR